MPQIVVMGVSAAGKSTVGSLLAERLGVPFTDADDLHPEVNRAKMAAGVPLADDDRWPWLDLVGEAVAAGGVVACSALRRSYRDRIRLNAPQAFFVHLGGTDELLRSRAAARIGHFMPASLLDSQLAILEPLQADENGVVLDVADAPADLAASAAREIELRDRS